MAFGTVCDLQPLRRCLRICPERWEGCPGQTRALSNRPGCPGGWGSWRAASCQQGCSLTGQGPTRSKGFHLTSPRKEDRPPHCPTSVNRALHVTGAPGDEPARGRPGPGRPGAGWCCSGDSGLRPPCRARRPATPTRCRPSEEGLRPGAAGRMPELVPASGSLPASLARALPPAALVSCAACLCWAPGAALPLPRPLLHDATPHPGWSTSQESGGGWP